jgi:hypothetical protein
LKTLQNPSEINGDNLNNKRRETRKHFRNKKREYLKDKINEFAMNLRGVSNLEVTVKDENGDLLADSHNILNRWKKYFSQLLNIHGVSYVRQTEIHTAEPLVRDPSPIGVEIAIAKLKRYKSSTSDQISAEMIQAGGGMLRSEIRKLVNSIWSKEELPDP